jgi:hypothetical protein
MPSCTVTGRDSLARWWASLHYGRGEGAAIVTARLHADPTLWDSGWGRRRCLTLLALKRPVASMLPAGCDG